MNLTRAYCERCSTSVEVTADDLLEFDCRCPTCDTVLILVADEEGTRDFPRAAEQEIDPDLHYLPGKKGKIKPRDRRRPRTTKLLKGRGPLAPPLPEWDGSDTSELRRLAADESQVANAQTLPPPVSFGDELGEAVRVAKLSGELPAFADVLDEVETVELPAGSVGKGSRTFDREDVIRSVSSSPDDETRGWDDADRKRVFPKDFDPDWEALLDEGLAESGEDEDVRPSRVVIKVPKHANPDSPTMRRITGLLEMHGIQPSEEEMAEAISAAEKHGDSPSRTMDLPGKKKRPQTGDTRTLNLPPDARDEEDEGDTRTINLPPRNGGKRDRETQRWNHDELEAQAAPQPGVTKKARTRVVSRRFARAEDAPPPLKVVEAVHYHQLDQALVCARHPGSVEAESYLALYQRILGEERNQVVLVTSPTPLDGRTTVAANLALIAAQTPGRGALLVDADPWGRGVLPPFGLQASSSGLLNVLRTKSDPRRFVIQFRLGSLDVVPLGTQGRDAGLLLCSDDMGAYLEDMRELYPTSLIVVDGASVLRTASPLAISRHVDNVILVVRRGHTNRAHVRRAAQVLGHERIMGVVFNEA